MDVLPRRCAEAMVERVLFCRRSVGPAWLGGSAEHFSAAQKMVVFTVSGAPVSHHRMDTAPWRTLSCGQRRDENNHWKNTS